MDNEQSFKIRSFVEVANQGKRAQMKEKQENLCGLFAKAENRCILIAFSSMKTPA